MGDTTNGGRFFGSLLRLEELCVYTFVAADRPACVTRQRSTRPTVATGTSTTVDAQCALTAVCFIGRTPTTGTVTALGAFPVCVTLVFSDSNDCDCDVSDRHN